MNKFRLLAACAALPLVVAACGDDDDDASDDTSPATIAAPAAEATTTAAAAAPTDTAGAPTDTADAAGAATDPGAALTLPGGDASPEVVADCQAIFTAVSGIAEDAPDDPAVGEEIPDDYKDAVQALIDAVEETDLQSDEVQSAVDSVVDSGNELIDADTWTEELQTESQDAFAPLTEVCAATFATSATGG